MKKILLTMVMSVFFSFVLGAVEFLGFHAVQENNFIVLDWSTATETENVGFILERKIDSLEVWSHLVSYLEDDALRGQGTVSSQSDYTYTDTTTIPGTYYYRISGVDMGGAIGRLDSLSIELTETATRPLKADHFNLHAFPNPFNPAIRIYFELGETRYLDINVYSTEGALIQHLYDGIMAGGFHDIVWDAGTRSSGLYILTLRSGPDIQTLKLILMR
jgi:hypothetical protein